MTYAVARWSTPPASEPLSLVLLLNLLGLGALLKELSTLLAELALTLLGLLTLWLLYLGLLHLTHGFSRGPSRTSAGSASHASVMKICRGLR